MADSFMQPINSHAVRTTAGLKIFLLTISPDIRSGYCSPHLFTDYHEIQVLVWMVYRYIQIF